MKVNYANQSTLMHNAVTERDYLMHVDNDCADCSRLYQAELFRFCCCGTAIFLKGKSRKLSRGIPVRCIRPSDSVKDSVQYQGV